MIWVASCIDKIYIFRYRLVYHNIFPGISPASINICVILRLYVVELSEVLALWAVNHPSLEVCAQG